MYAADIYMYLYFLYIYIFSPILDGFISYGILHGGKNLCIYNFRTPLKNE